MDNKQWKKLLHENTLNEAEKAKFKKGDKVNFIEWGEPLRDPNTMSYTGKTAPDKKYPDVIAKVEYREYNAMQQQRWEYYLRKMKKWVPDYQLEKR